MVRPSVFAMLAVLSVATACSENAPVATADAAIASAKQAWDSIYEKTSWSPVYSKQSTARFEPYTATLENGVWVVRGTVPAGYQGEVLESTVRQSDGQVSVKVVVVR